MEAMEITNPFGVLAESQENGLQAHTNLTENPLVSAEISAKDSEMAESHKDAHSESAEDGGHTNSRRNWADCPELDDQLPDDEDEIFTTVGGSKKRPHDPDHANSGTKKGCVQAPRIPPNSSRPRATPRPSRVHDCQTTRQKQATFRTRSAAGQADQCVYLEFCPDFTQEQYFWALEAKLGKGTVYQLTKLEEQTLIGLSNVQQADKFVEDGLEIEDAILRATPLKKRAERIVFGNVPFFIENGDLVAALQPYGQITSIVQKMLELGDAYWADAPREAFITVLDGVKLSHIPARLEIKSKGVTSHVYVTYGIRCSLCQKKATNALNAPGRLVSKRLAYFYQGTLLAPKNAGRRQPPFSNTMPALSPTKAAGPPSTAAPTPAASSAPPAAPPPHLLHRPKLPPLWTQFFLHQGYPATPHEKKKEKTQVSSPSGTPLKTRKQLNDIFERVPNDILDQPELEGLERSEILEALATVPGLKKLQKKIGDEQKTALTRVAEMLVEALPNSHSAIYKRLMAETNVSSLDFIQDLCLGYRAIIVSPAALRGSGLACLFAPGVAVLRQCVLWPGNISIVSIDVRGQEVRVINCHLTHIPRERLEQLESIKAAAIQEDTWVVGDLNIDDQSTSDTASGSVEALTELMEQTALDVATLFDAAHLPTRVASCRRRVDTARLDRSLLPSRLLERLGPPPYPRQPCVAAILRSVLVEEYLLTTIERTSESIADMSSEAMWIRWSKIKAELLAEVRSLHVSSVADDDHISRAGRFLQARLEEASSSADYPSLPDLVRSLRVQSPASTNIRDEDGSIIEGGELRRRAYSIYQRRFAREPSDPIAAAELIRGTTTPLTLEENDPLIRPVITGAEIIRRLPLGRAPGWDDLPCEFLIAYEDFFVEALRRVFEASKLCGALPSSIRRSTICLVPKSNGGPGISAYRPISLSTADYRVLGNILLQRLRPHLPVLVPRGQTYAVPGRSSIWNVAKIADEIHMATRNGSELAVISTDLESAFDTLDRGFLVYLMVSLWLPPAFIEWFLLLPFHLLNGVRQGCAVSAALFSLATGPLLVRFERALGPGNVLWVPFTRGHSLVGRARAANSLVLSAMVHHLPGYLPTDSTIAKLQARLVRFVWGPQRTAWLPGGVLARPVYVGGLGLLDIGTQLRLACLKGVQAALRGSLNAYSWLAASGTWLSPPTSGTWDPPRRRRLLRLWEAVSEILELNHRVLPPHQLQELHVNGDCRFLRPPDLLVASRWAGLRVGDITSSSPLPLRTTLADVAALTTFCSWLVEQNRNHTHRVDNIENAIVLRGTATLLQLLTTRTARRMLERPLLAALPITQLLGRWLPHGSIPISTSWCSLQRGAYSGHNADVAVRLALHALPHPAHPASARESCIACGSGDLSLAHRYWSCRRIRPVIMEAFTIIQRPPDLQSWIFGDDLKDNALAIMASAKTRIYKYFLVLELRGVQEDPLLVWRRTLSRCISISISLSLVVPSTTTVGSGLACVFAAGVVVHQQQILWPGKMAVINLTVRGGSMMCVNAHVSHAPEERCRQLQIIAAFAREEGAWILGDLNISEDSAKDMASGSAEALAELLDKADLVDIATFFDAALEHTRVATIGSRVTRVCRRRVLRWIHRESKPLPEAETGGRHCPLRLSFLALDKLLGGINIIHLTKMNGHVQVGLATKALAERLIEKGLEIEDTLLKTYPFRKRAERVVTNLPFFVEDAEIIAALTSLKTHCRIRKIPSISFLLETPPRQEVCIQQAGQEPVGADSRIQHAPLQASLQRYRTDCEPTMNLRVRTLNTRGLAARDRSLELCHFLAQHHVDIAFIKKTNKEYLDYAQDLCFATAPSSPRPPPPGAPASPATSCRASPYCDISSCGLDASTSAAAIEHLSSYIEDVGWAAEDLDDGELWSGWNRMKAVILAEIRSFYTTRPEPEDDYVTRANRYIRARLEASSTEADYPSLPDLGRALRLRRRVATIVRDEESEIMAIRTLPTGKAPGWDSLPCELLSAYEDFFSALLWRVFSASLVRGALPSSTRRGSICLVPKARSCPGFRPITLPSTDYRVLAVILLRRLRPHLPTLAIDCQTYAILGRSTSWNIARVTGEVEIATAGRLPLAVVSVDLKSAFDSLDRGFLLSLLASLGLPPVIAYADDIVLKVRQEEHFERCPLVRRLACPRRLSPRNFLDKHLFEHAGCDIRPRASADMQEGLLLDLLDAAFRRWAPFTRGLSLVGRARAANCLVLSSFMHHLHGYIPTDSSISKLQARLVRFVWGPDRTAWLLASVISRPVSLGGFGLLDLSTQMLLACIKGVRTALRGGLSAYSWLSESGAWLTSLPPGTWRTSSTSTAARNLGGRLGDPGLNHRVLPRNQFLDLTIIGGCRFLRPPPPDLLQWVGARFTSRLMEENCCGSHQVNSVGEAIVLPRTATPFQRLTTRRMLERPRLSRWQPQVDLPVTIAWSSLSGCAFSGHNAAVRLALHALIHPAHPASAQKSCIAYGSGYLSLAHHYWSCRRIRPVILEAFTIIQQPPDLQG
ncbi:hypothetical protein LAZ67_12002693 [Cordylochernes scorpioides]|uniref:Reverse transcriptase domain-containing protein n=1 Tax=Cordylochernes scorpioides TaxID=51811 RepID=A0ABY6L3U8_9ARAC|nr:hypothetical protein LAZ67_12002693 [Cordylochernes scorpioides]